MASSVFSDITGDDILTQQHTDTLRTFLESTALVGTAGHYNVMRKTWDSHFKYHTAKIENVKPMVDNSAPQTYLHCHLKMKKIQMEQERLMEVERDNRLLMSRVAQIKAKGGLDNWNDYLPKPSVNADLRNRELVKIALENQAILKKINTTKSVYDHTRWLEDFKVSRGYMARLLKYPQNPHCNLKGEAKSD